MSRSSDIVDKARALKSELGRVMEHAEGDLRNEISEVRSLCDQVVDHKAEYVSGLGMGFGASLGASEVEDEEALDDEVEDDDGG